MNCNTFLATIIDPGLSVLESLGGPKPTHDARRMLLAIAQQESGPGLDGRYQNSPSTSPGPARGWWQFEQNGGADGVLTHNSTTTLARSACGYCAVQPHKEAIWRALEGHDLLAVCFARLLLWTDPYALPTTQPAGWDAYIRQWRPGKPHPDYWPANWAAADQAVRR